MKRIKSNYHALKVLKSAQPKLRKAIILNGNRELINSISECFLNVLNGNLKVSDWAKRKLKKHKTVFRKVADKRVPQTTKKRLIKVEEVFCFHCYRLSFRQSLNFYSGSVPIKCHVKCISFQLISIIIHGKHLLHHLHHMWKQRQSRKLPLKKRRQHPYDKWVRFRERIQETNIKRGALIKEFAEFKKNYYLKINHISRSKIELLEQTPQRRFEVPPTSDTKDDIYGEIASPFLSPDTRLLDTK